MDPIARVAEIVALLSAGGLSTGEMNDLLDELKGDITDALLDKVNDGTEGAMEALAAAADATEQIVGSLADAAAAVAQRDADAAAAVERIRNAAAPGGEDDDPDPVEGDDPDADEDADADEEPAAPASASAPVPVAASAAPRALRTRARAAGSTVPGDGAGGLAPQNTWESLALVASPNAPQVKSGAAFKDPLSLGESMLEAFKAMGTNRSHASRVVVASASRPMRAWGMAAPGSRLPKFVEAGGSVIRNTQIIDEATREHRAIVAAGGICAPQQVNYDLPTVGSKDRPVRDRMMVRVGADRGGIRTIPGPQLSDVAAGIGIWTHANDLSPALDEDDNVIPKNCVTVTCPTETEDLVDAYTTCLTAGTFRQRYFAEQITAWLDLLGVASARQAEQALLIKIAAGSTAVTGGKIISATVDAITHLHRLIAGIKSRQRLSSSVRWTFGAPEWLKDLLIMDLVRRMPSGTHEENLAVGEATVNAVFRAVLGTDPVWFLDGELTGQYVGAQSPGAITALPTTAITYLYPVGTWTFLDGGSLNIGWQRDATQARKNETSFFGEVFEGAHFHGAVPSYKITLTLDPVGSAAGLTAVGSSQT